jgi:hypothetical protein
LKEGVLTISPDYSDRPTPDFLALSLFNQGCICWLRFAMQQCTLKGECCGIDGSLRSFSVATRISFGRSGWIRLYWWIRSLVVDDVLIGAFCSHTAGYVILRNCSSNRFSSERSQPRYYPIGMTVLLFFWKHRAISLFRAC